MNIIGLEYNGPLLVYPSTFYHIFSGSCSLKINLEKYRGLWEGKKTMIVFNCFKGVVEEKTILRCYQYISQSQMADNEEVTKCLPVGRTVLFKKVKLHWPLIVILTWVMNLELENFLPNCDHMLTMSSCRCSYRGCEENESGNISLIIV